MNVIIRGGVLLGVLVTAWSWIFAFTGMHKNIPLMMVFPIVATVIEIVVLVWALKKTAAQGRKWFGQVSAGTMLAFVGGSLIFATSWMLVTMLYPNYFAELNEACRNFYAASGMDQATIDKTMAESAKTQSAGMQGVIGFTATVVTGLIASAIIAIWVRAK